MACVASWEPGQPWQGTGSVTAPMTESRRGVGHPTLPLDISGASFGAQAQTPTGSAATSLSGSLPKVTRKLCAALSRE